MNSQVVSAQQRHLKKQKLLVISLYMVIYLREINNAINIKFVFKLPLYKLSICKKKLEIKWILE